MRDDKLKLSLIESQSKLKIALARQQRLADDKTPTEEEETLQFRKEISQFWTDCLKDAELILQDEKPEKYEQVSSIMMNLAQNLKTLVDLIKQFMPLSEQEAMFLEASNLYGKYGFWVKNSNIMAGDGTPLDASPFFVAHYEARLNKLGQSEKDIQARKIIISEMASKQAIFLTHSLHLIANTEINLENIQKWHISQSVICNLVEEKFQLHQQLNSILVSEIKIPEEKIVKKIEDRISNLSVMIITYIFETCEKLLASEGLSGPQYCVLGTGSFARKELSPTSDFDCAILVAKKLNLKEEQYFRKLLDLVIECIELQPYNTLRIDALERAFLKFNILINTPEKLVAKGRASDIIGKPHVDSLDATTFGLNWPKLLHRSDIDKSSSSPLFLNYLEIWHKNVGADVQKFGKIILKKYLKGGDKDSIKSDLLRPVVFWALALDFIYNKDYSSKKSLVSAYNGGRLPKSTREILLDLQTQKGVPTPIADMSVKLLKVLNYGMTMRNHCQLNGQPEVINLEHKTIMKFQQIIQQSKDLVKGYTDLNTSIQDSEKGIGAFKKRKYSISFDYADLKGDDSLRFRETRSKKSSDDVSTDPVTQSHTQSPS